MTKNRETTTVLEARDIHKTFGKTDVLKGASLSVRSGRITAILGPNGSGKSTLNKILLGLVRPDKGSIFLNGEAVNGQTEYRRHIGYMPQTPKFPENLTPSGALKLILSLRKHFKPINIDSIIDEFEIRPWLDRPLGVCSGGQRQRVNAAMALMFNPGVLVLDEPTTGLDPVSSSTLKKRIIAEKERGTAILVTSHILSELETLADDVVFLMDGKVCYSGSLDELLNNTSSDTLESAIARLMTTNPSLLNVSEQVA